MAIIVKAFLSRPFSWWMSLADDGTLHRDKVDWIRLYSENINNGRFTFKHKLKQKFVFFLLYHWRDILEKKNHLVVQLILSVDERLLSQHLCILGPHSQNPFTGSKIQFLWKMTNNLHSLYTWPILTMVAEDKSSTLMHLLWSHLWRTAENLPGQQ